ncbi:hypothetical protein COV42_01700, partial [Candidatus Campbellbacteria bacterium CG11_big_fil_rev_8_21_14_0_20_44_21]
MEKLFENKDLRILLKIVLILLVLFLLAQSLNSLKENRFIGRAASDPSTISVSGRGEVTAVPDIAVFSMTLSA